MYPHHNVCSLTKLVDCGQLSGLETVGEKIVDSTGDPYESYPEDQGKDFKGPEIVKIATELKEYGNKAFKSGDLNLAIEKYQKGLRYIREYPEALDDDPAELAQQLKAIRFSLHSNSALLQIKLNAFDDALSSATSAIGIEKIPEGDKAKGYYRKALASINLKNDDQAITDLEEALKLAPSDSAIIKELGIVKKRVAEKVRKEKAAYKKFFD